MIKEESTIKIRSEKKLDEMVTRRRGVSYRRVGSGSYGREADVVISMLMIRPRDRRNIIIMRPPGNGLGHGAVPHTGSALRF